MRRHLMKSVEEGKELVDITANYHYSQVYINADETHAWTVAYGGGASIVCNPYKGDVKVVQWTKYPSWGGTRPFIAFIDNQDRRNLLLAVYDCKTLEDGSVEVEVPDPNQSAVLYINGEWNSKATLYGYKTD